MDTSNSRLEAEWGWPLASAPLEARTMSNVTKLSALCDPGDRRTEEAGTADTELELFGSFMLFDLCRATGSEPLESPSPCPEATAPA